MRMDEFVEEMKAKGVGVVEAAEALGIRRQSLHLYRSGAQIPGRGIMRRIYELSGGRVTPNDFFKDAWAAEDAKKNGRT